MSLLKMENYEPERSFLLLKLKPGTTYLNVVSYYLLQFTTQMLVQFLISFLIQILQHPHYFAVPPSKVATVAGNAGFWGGIAVVAFDMVLGVIFDSIGRKTPTVIGFWVAGVSAIVMPFLSSVYPGFLVTRIMLSLGVIPGVNVPLLPDYIKEESQGLANAYVRTINVLTIDIVKRRGRSWVYNGNNCTSEGLQVC